MLEGTFPIEVNYGIILCHGVVMSHSPDCVQKKFTQGNVTQTEDGCGHYVCVTFCIQVNQLRLLLV